MSPEFILAVAGRAAGAERAVRRVGTTLREGYRPSSNLSPRQLLELPTLLLRHKASGVRAERKLGVVERRLVLLLSRSIGNGI